MNSENKLFKSGEVILKEKNDGFGAVIISIVIGFTLWILLNKFLLPDHWFSKIPSLLISLFIGLVIYIRFFQTLIYPSLRFGRRYKDIVIFDDYLVGRMDWRKGVWEDKIEYKDIEHIVQEEQGRVSIKFNDNYKPKESCLILRNNQTQDYQLSSKLSRQQKKELVNYINERIKSINIE